MGGLQIRGTDVSLFLGKLPNRKQECFYFAEGTVLIPVAYISERDLPEAKRLWQMMLDAVDKTPTK